MLLKIETDQRRADPLRQRRPEDGVDQRAPDQIAGDRQLVAEQMQRRGLGHPPQDDDKGEQRHDRAQQADAEIQRSLDEQLDVVGEALIRVIGRVSLQLHAVVVRAVKPLAEIFGGHPVAPADLQPLIEIELVDRQHDQHGGQHGKDDGLPDKAAPVLLLQRVVETVAPQVQHHVVSDQRQLDADHRGEQAAAGPFVFGSEIRGSYSPHDGERRADVVHRCRLRGNGLKGLKNWENRERLD